MVLTDDRVGSIDGEEDGALTGEMLTAPDVAGFAADVFAADTMLDEERFDETDEEKDGARCATARHGKPASKTTNGKNRPQKRNMVPPPNELQTR
jgi:hypothetical protein